MPTGPAHRITTEIQFGTDGNEYRVSSECRCMIGEDHDAYPMILAPFEQEDDEEGGGEKLSESDAEDIYLSSGQDEDYDFR